MEHSVMSVDKECKEVLVSRDVAACGTADDLQVTQSLVELLSSVEGSLCIHKKEPLDVAVRPSHSQPYLFTSRIDRGTTVRSRGKGNQRCTAPEIHQSRPTESRLNDMLTSVPLTQLSVLMFCEACHTAPMTSLTVHTCANGHQVCGHCYSSGQRTCEECKKPLDCRNELVETFLQQLRQICPDLFLQRDLSSGDSAGQDQAEVDSFRALQHSSHRALTCPHLTCFRVVASNGFLAHFKFEHPSVPVFQMYPILSQTFNLPQHILVGSLPHAVAVIEVNIVSDDTGCELERRGPRTLFPVRRDALVCVLLGATVQFGNCSFLMVWCSCLYEDRPPISYSLQTKTVKGGETRYSGELMSLHHCQDPLHILQHSTCLVLSPDTFHQLCVQNNGVAPVELKFMKTKLSPSSTQQDEKDISR